MTGDSAHNLRPFRSPDSGHLEGLEAFPDSMFLQLAPNLPVFPALIEQESQEQKDDIARTIFEIVNWWVHLNASDSEFSELFNEISEVEKNIYVRVLSEPWTYFDDPGKVALYLSRAGIEQPLIDKIVAELPRGVASIGVEGQNTSEQLARLALLKFPALDTDDESYTILVPEGFIDYCINYPLEAASSVIYILKSILLEEEKDPTKKLSQRITEARNMQNNFYHLLRDEMIRTVGRNRTAEDPELAEYLRRFD